MKFSFKHLHFMSETNFEIPFFDVQKMDENWPHSSFSELKNFFNYIGWNLEEIVNLEAADVEKVRTWKVSDGNHSTRPFNLNELTCFTRWFVGRLQWNEHRWMVINAYFESDEVEKQEILIWLTDILNSPWFETYKRMISFNTKTSMHLVKSIFHFPKEEIVLHGLRVGGLLVSSDKRGGEHLELEDNKPFTGYILREIRREEWRRLNARIPEAQA